jgi:hypothetical protein
MGMPSIILFSITKIRYKVFKHEYYLQFFEPRHIEMYQTDWMPEKASYKPATTARKSIVI